jgi:hypothetical protein
VTFPWIAPASARPRITPGPPPLVANAIVIGGITLGWFQIPSCIRRWVSFISISVVIGVSLIA